MMKKHETAAVVDGGCGDSAVGTLINSVRVQQGMHRLEQCTYLDLVCHMHVESIALRQHITQSTNTFEELQILVNSEAAAETVLDCGQKDEPSLETILSKALLLKGNDDDDDDDGNKDAAGANHSNNMLSKDFLEFGVATARSKNGTWYMVFLFRGPEIENVPFVCDEEVDYNDDDEEMYGDWEEAEDDDNASYNNNSKGAEKHSPVVEKIKKPNVVPMEMEEESVAVATTAIRFQKTAQEC